MQTKHVRERITQNDTSEKERVGQTGTLGIIAQRKQRRFKWKRLEQQLVV